MKLIFILVSIFLCSQTILASQGLKAINDAETIKYLYGKAVKLSGLNPMPIDALPPIYKVSKSQMNHIVCPNDPENCRNLAAVFDDIEYRILILDDFEISENFKPYDYSFVIHELIHALQYNQFGPEIFKDCRAIFETEKVAYLAQDRYLSEQGSFHRVAHFLRFFVCDEEVARLDYLKSKKVWEQRQQSKTFSE